MSWLEPCDECGYPMYRIEFMGLGEVARKSAVCGEWRVLKRGHASIQSVSASCLSLSGTTCHPAAWVPVTFYVKQPQT